MSDRELPNWLDAYLEYTDRSEPPTSYHTWCALSVIAGALQRRVYLQQGLERAIYPNLYVILIGPSGRVRKGVALGIAKELLSKVGTVSIAPESASGREALCTVMKRSLSSFTDPSDGGKMKEHCAISAFSEELSVFLGQGDIKLLANLTDWYDSKDNWEYESIGRGKDTIRGVCFNMVGGTAPEWISSMLPREAIGGGYTSRVIFIVEEWKKHTVPNHNLTPREHELAGALERDLNRIALLCGAFEFTGEAHDAYDEWYVNEDKKMRNGYLPVEDQRFISYCERRTTHLRKLMMVCSAARSDELRIELPDFHKALGLLRSAEAKMHKAFGGLGSARYSDMTDQIMNFIANFGSSTRKILMQRFHRDVDAEALRKIEDTMRSMGVVQIRVNPKDPHDVLYVWTGEKPNNN